MGRRVLPQGVPQGEYLTTVYHPFRTATFPAETDIVCYKFASDGSTGTTKTVRFAKSSNAPFDRRAFVNGRPMVQITASALTGYRVAHSDLVLDGS